MSTTLALILKRANEQESRNQIVSPRKAGGCMVKYLDLTYRTFSNRTKAKKIISNHTSVQLETNINCAKLNLFH